VRAGKLAGAKARTALGTASQLRMVTTSTPIIGAAAIDFKSMLT